MAWLFLLLCLLATTGGAPLLWLLGLTRSQEVYFFSNRTLFWVCLLLTWWYCARVEKQPLLLWEEQRRGFGHYLAAIILLTVVILVSITIAAGIVTLVLHRKENSELVQKLIRYFRQHQFLLFYSAVTAGVTEELLFRGYLLPRLELLTRNRYVSIFISSLLFGLAHYKYGTVRNVVDAMVIGSILALYYERYRNIKVVILFHVLWDVSVIYLAIRNGTG